MFLLFPSLPEEKAIASWAVKSDNDGVGNVCCLF